MVFLFSLPAYAQQPNWTMYNSQVDYDNNTASPLPVGMSPDHSQNGLWDQNGNLICYLADGKLLDHNGTVLINQFEYSISPQISDQVYGFSEALFIPVPNRCDEFYVVLGHSRNSTNSVIVFAHIQVNQNSNSVAVLSQNNIVDLTCEDSDRNGEGEPQVVAENKFILLEASRELDNGTRKLFACTPRCLVTLEVNENGIHFLDGLQYQGVHFEPANLRTEMDIYQINNDVFEIVTPFFAETTFPNNKWTSGYNRFTLFTVDYSGSTPNYDWEHYKLENKPDEFSSTSNLLKGVEFSSDGLHLFITQAVYEDYTMFNKIWSGPHLLQFQRSTVGSPFNFIGYTFVDPSYSDFGMGQIEKGNNGKIYISGSGRLLEFPDNQLLSMYQIIYPPSLANPPSTANPLINTHVPSDIGLTAKRGLYLLPDQIDHDNTLNWLDASPDQWPPSITSCSSTTLNSQFLGTWLWLPGVQQSFDIENPCEIPQHFFDEPPGKQAPVVYEPSTTVTVQGSGTLLFFYGVEECCFYEEVHINAVELEPSTFSWVFVNDGASVNIALTANTQPAHLNYNWTIEEWDNTTSSWVPFQSVNNHGAVWNVSGLNILTDYRISLSVNLQPWAAHCVTWASPPTEINTGGRIGTESGVSEQPIIKNL